MANGEMLDLSLNEVEVLALKAGRGGGLSWGLAEDLGRSARWLAQAGVDWSALLLAILADPALLCSSRSGFTAGIALADMLPDKRVDCAEVQYPIWILPALYAASTYGGQAIAGSIGDLHFAFSRGRMMAECGLATFASVAAAPVTVGIAEGAGFAEVMVAVNTRSSVPADRYSGLESYVYRTYVPTSDKSRLRGAGGRH